MGAQLREYLAKRTELVGPLAPSDPVFSFGNDKSRPINPYTVTQTFQQLWPKLGAAHRARHRSTAIALPAALLRRRNPVAMVSEWHGPE